MDTITEPKLTDTEWQLVIELLETECRRLPAEIHHTHRHQFKQQLRQRFDLASALLSRLHGEQNP